MARQVARRLTRVYEAELQLAGMNPAQFELLANLRAEPGASQAALGRRMDLDQTTLSRNVKLLVAKGWVEATAGASDRRRVEYGLSAAGRLAVEAAMPHWERATARLNDALGDEAADVWDALEMLGAAG